MFKDPRTGEQLAFFGVFYIVFSAIFGLGILLKDYITPIAALIFPIADKPLWYNFAAMSLIYWIMVAIAMFLKKKPQ